MIRRWLNRLNIKPHSANRTMEAASAGRAMAKLHCGGMNRYQTSGTDKAVATRPPASPPSMAERKTAG
ncbi:hypothetical protein DB032_15090 [Chromobacterium sp. Panama]|nr:hypothetical protein DB032_15090 [Chromobacterium sp. Panama]